VAAAEAASDAAATIRRAISETPAAGPIGLAIKAYLFIHDSDGWAKDDFAAFSDRGDTTDLGKAILKDAIRFAPELAPLAAPALTPKGGVA
jgi:hypothetical protein